MPIRLTEAQEQLAANVGSVFVEACPGAGKTGAIVERFVRRTEQEPRKGIGLLSFTNAAIDEARARCSDHPESLKAPHFLGTFDSFINRFVVSPLYIRDHARQPRFVEKWSVIENSTIRLPNLNGDPKSGNNGYELDWFSAHPDGTLTLEESSIGGSRKIGLRQFAAANNEALIAKARWMRNRLVASGIISSSASRALAFKWLANPTDRALMGRLLSARFSELIIDEAQDCGTEELTVLSLAREYGVELAMVADLDQSIYEFRRAVPAQVQAFVQQLPQGRRLDGNFRSTPAVCSINASLRSSQTLDIPLGRHAESTTPIQLIPYDRLTAVAQLVRDVAKQQAIRDSQIIVLAHRKSDARNAAGAAARGEAGGNRVVCIALASRALRDPKTDSRTKRKACDDLERVLLSFAQARVGDLGTELACEEVGLSRGWLRDAAVRIALGIDDPQRLTSARFTAMLRSKLNSLPWPSSVKTGKLRAPDQAAWKVVEAGSRDSLRWSTIHGVKGCQFPAVALVIPEKLPQDATNFTALDHWGRRSDAESKRVLYVGASRAEELLMLAVHKAHLESVQQLLARDSVPFI